MTQRRDIERLLDAWLAEGSLQVPDRIFDAAVARLRREPRSRARRLPWRDYQMTMPMRLAAAAAIIAIVGLGLGGLNFVSDFGAMPTPTIAPTQAPTATANSSSCIRGECDGVLAAGNHRADAPLVPFDYAVADGWQNIFNDVGGYVLRRNDGEPPGHGLYIVYDVQAANLEECSIARAAGVGTTAADLVGWLETVPGVAMSNRSTPTLGGLSGQAFDLTATGEGRQCDGERKLFVQDWSGDPSFWWGIGVAERQHMIVLERGSGGNVVIIVAGPDDGRFASFANHVSPIFGTIAFEKQCATDEPACTGPLAPGTHATGALAAPLTYTVPAGWSKRLDLPGALNLLSDEFITSYLAVWPEWRIASQGSCTRDPEPGRAQTVEEFVAFVTTHPGIVATTPQPVTIGGLSGQLVDIRPSRDWTGPCATTVNLFTHTGTVVDDGGWIDLTQTMTIRFAFLETEGNVLTVALEVQAPEDFEAFAAVAAPIIESFDFVP